MSKMITVRMSEDRPRAIDELVASGRASRAAVIVEAIDRLVSDLERERIDRAIVEGYTRIPQTAEELRVGRVSRRVDRSRGALVSRGEMWWVERIPAPSEAARRSRCVTRRSRCSTTMLGVPRRATSAVSRPRSSSGRRTACRTRASLSLDNATLMPKAFLERAHLHARARANGPGLPRARRRATGCA